MEAYSIILVVLPLLVFVIVDSFASLNVALIAALLVAVGECVFSYVQLGQLDSFSLFSIFLVLVLVAVSFLKKSRKIFFLKPALLNFCLGAFLVVTYFMGEFVLLDGMLKYSGAISDEVRQAAESIQFQEMLKNCSLTVGGSMILHSFIAVYAALHLTRWWWFVVAGLGGYVFLFLGVIAAVKL